LLQAIPFVYAAFQPHFYRNAVEPAAAIFYGSLLVGLVRRHRWAWLALVVLDFAALLSVAWADGASPLLLVTDLIALALLVSPPMRYYLRKS
jgi:hypothetical protein